VDIPLRLLYRKVNEIVVNIFNYETGSSTNQSPFSILGDKVTLAPKPLHIKRAETTTSSISPQEKN